MDKEIVSRSLDKTLEVWEWDETWGWDYALLNALGFLATGCDSNPGCKFPKDWDVKVEDIVQYV